MAKSRKAENISPKQLRQIWFQISPANWLDLLKDTKPNNKWKLDGLTIRGLCPFHEEKTPSFVINLQRGGAHCFGSSCNKSHWDPIRFMAEITSTGYATTLRKLKKQFEIKLPTAFTDHLQEIEDNDILKWALLDVMNQELVDALQDPQRPEFEYIERAGLLNWLKQRQFPEEAAHMWPVGVMLPQDRLRALFEARPEYKALVDPAIDYLSTYFATPGSGYKTEGYFVIFCFVAPDKIGRLKIRRPGSKDRYVVDDPYSEAVGFFGLNMFPEILNQTGKIPLRVIEGEMCVLSVYAHLRGSESVCMVATAGGMDADKLDQLKEFGFTKAHAIPDNDTAGIGWAEKLLRNSDLVTRIFRWDPTQDIKIKDVDEAIRAHGFDNIYARLKDKKNLPRVHEWTLEQLEVAISTVDDSDIRAHVDAAARLGSMIRNDAERDVFLDAACEVHGFQRSSLLQRMVSSQTEGGFIQHLALKFHEVYHFMTNDQQGATPLIKVWSKRKRVIRSFVMERERAVRATLQADVGVLESFITEEMGIPDFLVSRPDTRERPIPISSSVRRKWITELACNALTIASRDAIQEQAAIELGQGLHLVHPEGELSRVYIVNGNQFFKGTIEGKKVTYEELECPKDGDYVFRLAHKGWSRNLTSVKNIEAGQEYDPRRVYDKIYEILQLGWKFMDQDLESQYMAGLALYTPIADVFGYMVMTSISGDTQSGKTSLMQILGGNQFPGYRICEPTDYIDDFSAAGVRQRAQGYRLHLMLDEFEDRDDGSTGDRRMRATRDILHMVRDISTGSVSTRGTTSGDPLEFRLQCPFTVAGLFTMREARDVNRFIHIRTKKIEGLRDPIVPVRRKFTPEDMTELRQELASCWLHLIPEILEIYPQIEDEFAYNERLLPGTDTRLKRNLYPLLTLMKIIGLDYQKFMIEFTTLKMKEMEDSDTVSESVRIWEHVLFTLFRSDYLGRDRPGMTSLSRVLSNPETAHLLDDTDIGAYFIPEKKWLIVFWQKAVGGVLKNSRLFGGTQFPGNLKMSADADPRVIPSSKIRKGGFLKKYVWPHVGAQIGATKISVIDLKETLSQEDTGEPIDKAAAKRKRLIEDAADGGETQGTQGDFSV